MRSPYLLFSFVLFFGLFGGYLSPLSGINIFFALSLVLFLFFSREIKFSIDSLVYLFFALFSLSSSFWAKDKGAAILFSLSILSGALFYMILRSSENLDRYAIRGLLLAGLINAGIGFFQGINGQPIGLFYNRNPYAGFLAPLFPLSLHFYFSSKRKVFALSSGFLFFSILLSSSRGAIYSTLIFLCLFLLYLLKEKRVKEVESTLLICLLSLSFYLLFLFIKSLLQLPSEGIVERGIETERWNMFKAYPELFFASPIFGHGMNNFFPLSDKVFSPSLNLFVHGQTHAHNLFFNILLELGIVGFLLFLLFLFFVFKGGFSERVLLRLSLLLFLMPNMFEYNFPAPCFQILFLSLCSASIKKEALREVKPVFPLRFILTGFLLLSFLFFSFFPSLGQVFLILARDEIVKRHEVEKGYRFLVYSSFFGWPFSHIHGATASFLRQIYEVQPDRGENLIPLIESYYQKALKWNKGDIGLFVEVAKFYSRIGKKDRSESYLLEALREFPYSLRLKRELASFYLSQGKMERALRILFELDGFFERYAQRHIERIPVLELLSEIYERKGQKEKAEELRSKIREIERLYNLKSKR